MANYNLNYNDPQSLNKYFEFITTNSKYGVFLGYEFGFDKFTRSIIIGDVLMPLYLKLKDASFMREDLCLMMYFDPTDPELVACENRHQRLLAELQK